MTADRLDLDALAALEAAATEGEWMLDTADVNARFHVATVTAEALRGEDPAAEVAWGDYDGNVRMRPADAALIVALRNAAPALIAAARNARPCDGGCSYNDGPQEDCSLHGRSPADLWQMLITACAGRDAAQAALARVEALHFEVTVQIIASDGSLTDRVICQTCTLTDGEHILRPEEAVRWPCATIRAVAGEGQEAGGK